MGEVQEEDHIDGEVGEQRERKLKDMEGEITRIKSGISQPEEDGEVPQHAEAEPTEDEFLGGSGTSEGGVGAENVGVAARGAATPQDGDEAAENKQHAEEESLVSTAEPPTDESHTGESSSQGPETNGVMGAPARPHDGAGGSDEKGEEASVSSNGEPTGDILSEGLRPRKQSLVFSGEPTEENTAVGGGEGVPKLRYFCPPNQNLTSDAWKIFFYHMLPFTTVPHFFILACLWWAYHEWGWTALLFYTTICAMLTFSTPLYSRRLRAAVSDYFYGLLARYVPSAQYAVPDEPFPEDRPYIFACHPHGRMFYSTIIFSQLHYTWRQTILQKGDLFMTAAGMFFIVPLLRNLFYLVGVIPVEKKDIVAKLRNKDHVTILVGGVKEVLLGTEDDADIIYLKHRKGFCKIAMQENAGVVPVYFFNENQMFTHNSKAFLRFWERVNKTFKVGVPFMRGRFFILPMPFRRPLLMAVGEPLFAKDGESVEDFHERYMQALRALFDKYVPYSPKPNHKLIMQ